MILASMMLTMTACAGHPQVCNFNELPAAAQTFITTYFDKADIAWAQWERDGVGRDYEVKLTDGTDIEFDENGKLEKIECKPREVPAGIVPAQIITYLKANMPNAFVVEYSIDRRKQEVELNSGVDLVFDLNGRFLYIDD